MGISPGVGPTWHCVRGSAIADVTFGPALAWLHLQGSGFSPSYGRAAANLGATRVEAPLKLGDRQEAKRELATLPLESVGRKLELRLIRAELRAEDDCQGAVSDFEVLLAQSLPSAWTERALFGRGACLLNLGDRVGATRDFSRYLEEFPSGRFAAQIRARGGG